MPDEERPPSRLSPGAGPSTLAPPRQTNVGLQVPTNERQMRLVSQSNDSFFDDPLIRRFLPYSSNARHVLIQDPLEFPSKAFGTTRMTSSCRQNPVHNEYRRVYRKLGRKIYSIREPSADLSLYPLDSCENWASEVWKLLDSLLVFDPTVLVTREQIPAVIPQDNPDYGSMYLTLMNMRNRVIGSPEAFALHIPVWPQAGCIFHEEAFKLAAVFLTDEVECFAIDCGFAAAKKTVFAAGVGFG